MWNAPESRWGHLITFNTSESRVALIERSLYNNSMTPEQINEQTILRTIERLNLYLRDPDAPATEAIENALYDLRDQLK